MNVESERCSTLPCEFYEECKNCFLVFNNNNLVLSYALHVHSFVTMVPHVSSLHIHPSSHRL